MWWIVVALQLSSSYAQLTPPGEAVCVGEQVVFVCQQTGSTSLLTWRVILDGRTTIERTVLSPQVGTNLTFENDPGFGFETHILSSNSTGIISELHATAVRQLNDVTVECRGGSGSFMSTIQIVSVATPSGVMTTADQSQFTPSTASTTLTWSASSEADNYTIIVTPLLPSGQSLVSITTTSLQLTVLYNEEYSINITAHKCAESNSIIVPLTVVGCSPPSPLAHGSISEYSSGAVGAMLTFQCDTGYVPREQVTSTCLSNSSWVPTPGCQVIDCGIPFGAPRVFIEPSNNTYLDALITFYCEESNTTMTAVCGNNGQWEPNPMSLKCGNESTTGNSKVPVTDDSNLNVTDSSDSHSQVGIYVGISVTTLLVVLITLLMIIMAVVVVKRRQGVNVTSKRSLELVSYECHNQLTQGDCEYAQTRHPGPRRNNQVGSEEYSVLSETAITTSHKPPSCRGDTLIYADLGPSSGKRRTPVTSNIQDDHRVVYSTVNHALQQVTKKSKSDKTGSCQADAALDLDMLLIQLKPQVLTKWKQFAEAVGLSNIIKELSQYSEDECIVEVFDQWLKSHPTKPTWRNVADVLNDIGLQQLANDIMKVYETGNLPIAVDMDAVPEMTTSDTETPPPLPPKIDNDDLFLPTRPPKPAVY